MSRVFMATQPWGVVWDMNGNVLAGLSATVKNRDGSNATHYSARTGGSSAATSIITSPRGTLDRWIDPGEYTLTVDGSTYDIEVAAGVDPAATNAQPGVLAPSTLGWSVAASGLTANMAYLMRFVPARDVTAVKIAFAVSTASGADDAFDVGIYSSALTRLVSSGAKTSGSGGVTGGGLNSTGVKVVDVTSTALRAGDVYYAAFSAAAAGATLRAASFGSDFAAQLFGTAVGTGEAFTKSASHVLPSSIATPTATSLVPMMAVRES
jgi:hypothetical protein